MVQYIKKISDELSKSGSPEGTSVFALSKALSEELERLDPRDFLPGARYEFVVLRTVARNWAKKVVSSDFGQEFKAFAKRVSTCLDSYGGEGSRAVSRSFNFIIDVDLRTVVERDYRELSLILFPGGAWKSVVVMAGSILEAILYDQLTKDAQTQTSAINSAKAPQSDLLKGQWRLIDLINVAVDINILPASRAASIDQILRDYRNFVHPKKEIRNAHPCTEAEALLSKGALDSVCNHLE
jgi:hypothetical protein